MSSDGWWRQTMSFDPAKCMHEASLRGYGRRGGGGGGAADGFDFQSVVRIVVAPDRDVIPELVRFQADVPKPRLGLDG